MINSKSNNFNIQILVFCLIIIQSIGIRFFNGQGIILSIIVIMISFKNFKKLTIKDVRFLFLALLFLTVSKFTNSSFTFSSLVYLISLIISTYLFLVGYRSSLDRLQNDFFKALQIFVFHSMIGYCLYLILPGQFIQFNILNKSFYNLFYVSTSVFNNLQRNTGIFWEPGVFQLVANLYLFYCIKFNKGSKILLFAILAIVSSYSTTGLIILMINLTYLVYLKRKLKKITLTNTILLLFATIAFIPIVSSNVTDKIDEDNTSALVRLRDFNIGIELIKEKPIIGHGVFDSEYLIKKEYVKKWESNLFSNEYLDISGDMGGGYTNGLLGLVAWFGIPVSLLLYLFYFYNRFIDNDFIERFLFNLIMLISLLSEPISFTSLFLMFPFSYWVLNKKNSIKRITGNFALGNYYKKKLI